MCVCVKTYFITKGLHLQMACMLESLVRISYGTSLFFRILESCDEKSLSIDYHCIAEVLKQGFSNFQYMGRQSPYIMDSLAARLPMTIYYT